MYKNFKNFNSPTSDFRDTTKEYREYTSIGAIHKGLVCNILVVLVGTIQYTGVLVYTIQRVLVVLVYTSNIGRSTSNTGKLQRILVWYVCILGYIEDI